MHENTAQLIEVLVATGGGYVRFYLRMHTYCTCGQSTDFFAYSTTFMLMTYSHAVVNIWIHASMCINAGCKVLNLSLFIFDKYIYSVTLALSEARKQGQWNLATKYHQELSTK